MKASLKKILSLFVAIVMVVGLIPAGMVTAWAEETTPITDVKLTHTLEFNTAYTEAELAERIRYDVVAPADAPYRVNTANSGLCRRYYEGGALNYVYGDVPLDPEVQYYIDVLLEITDSGYNWVNGWITTDGTPDFSEVTFSINGVTYGAEDIEAFYYNDYWNSVNLTIAAPAVSSEPVVKNLEVLPDVKSVQKGTNFLFTADVMGTAAKTVTWSVIGAESANTAISADGLLTVGEDETATSFKVRATSTANPNKYDESRVDVLNEAPTMTLEVNPASAELYAGDSDVWFYAFATGTEADKTIQWTLVGNTSENTVVEGTGAYNHTGILDIGVDETAETIQLVATSVHYPEVKYTVEITVHQPEKVSQVDFTYDAEKVILDPTMNESQLRQAFVDSLATDTPGVVQSWLIYEMDRQNEFGYWENILNSEDPVDPATVYGMKFSIYLDSEHVWSDEIKNAEISAMTVTLNGVAYQPYSLFYNDYWNCVEVYVIPELPTVEAQEDPAILGAYLSVGQDLSMVYTATLGTAEIPAGSTLGMRFTRGDVEVLTWADDPDANGVYSFYFYNIPPQCMGDTIRAEMVIINAQDEVTEVLAVNDGYSVKAYIADTLEELGNTDPLTTQLLTDILYYGAAAQKYTGYKDETPVTENVAGLTTPSDAAPVEGDNAMNMTATEDENVRFTSAGVHFDYTTNIFVNVMTDKAVSVVVKLGGEEIDRYDLEASAEVQRIDTWGMYAYETDQIYTFEIYNGENLIQSLNYSENTYIYRKLANAGEQPLTDMQALALSFYRYGKSADQLIDQEVSE